MNVKRTVAVLFALSSAMSIASAQTDQELAAAAQKSAINAPIKHVRAKIVGIDPATRTLMLNMGGQRAVPVVMSSEVRNFDRLKVGDQVDVLFKNALILKAVKATSADEGIRKRVETEVYTPSGNSPGYGSVKQVEIIATIQSINRQNKTITLRGAGRTDTFDLSPEMAADNLKPGDTIHAVFVSATAVQVTPEGGQ
jgi:Cu/Ag efflux protein CusF